MKKNNERFEIRIGGAGGQGILTTGVLLGEAAVLYSNRYAVQTQSYGPESRGGASRTDVIISTEEIDFPEIVVPDLVAVLSKEAFHKFASNMGPSVVRIMDSSIATTQGEVVPNSYSFPILETAVNDMGLAITANIILLGIIIGVSGVIALSSAEQAVVARFEKRNPALNLRALQKGYSMASAVKI